MIYNSTQTIERLSALVFDGCSIQDFLNSAEDILINPISFTPFKKLNDSIFSKSFPCSHLKDLNFSKIYEERENYVMKRMSQLEAEPIITEGGPGIPHGHILCWAMEKGKTCGLVCIAKTKIPLESIDKGLVVYISRCLAHIYAIQQLNKVRISPDEALERLLSGQITSYLQLSSNLPDYNARHTASYVLAVFKFSSERTIQIGPYLRNQFRESFSDSWCAWNGQYFSALVEYTEHGINRKGKTIKKLSTISSFFKSPVCISQPYENLMDSKTLFEHMISLPVFKTSIEPKLYFFEDYPECSLIFESKMDSTSLCNLTSPLYKTMKEYDNDNNTTYVETLKTYINSNFNVKMTSEKLFIHPNTVLYRLNRIEELFGLSYNNADAIFAFMFSVRLDSYI